MAKEPSIITGIPFDQHPIGEIRLFVRQGQCPFPALGLQLTVEPGQESVFIPGPVLGRYHQGFTAGKIRFQDDPPDQIFPLFLGQGFHLPGSLIKGFLEHFPLAGQVLFPALQFRDQLQTAGRFFGIHLGFGLDFPDLFPGFGQDLFLFLPGLFLSRCSDGCRVLLRFFFYFLNDFVTRHDGSPFLII